MAKRALRPQHAQHLQSGRCRCSMLTGIREPARRLAYREFDEQRDGKARQPDHVERGSPAVLLRDRTAQHQTRERSGVASHLVDRQRRRAPPRLEIVPDQGVSGGIAACLADAHTDASSEQMPEAFGETRERREYAPRRDRDSDDPHPVRSIRKACERHAERRVEERERKPTEKAHVRVGQAELASNRLDEDREQLSIHDVERVDTAEHPYDVVAIDLASPECDWRRPGRRWRSARSSFGAHARLGALQALNDAEREPHGGVLPYFISNPLSRSRIAGSARYGWWVCRGRLSAATSSAL